MVRQTVTLHVDEDQLEKVKKLAQVCHELGLTEKPSVGALIQLGLNSVWDYVNRVWLEVRDQKGDGE